MTTESKTVVTLPMYRQDCQGSRRGYKYYKRLVQANIQADDEMFIPQYKTDGSACLDCRADVLGTLGVNKEEYPRLEDCTVSIAPEQMLILNLGFRVAVPKGYVMNLYIRSGAAANNHLILANSVGKIDSDYRGIVKAILVNIGAYSAVIKHGDRIAQCEIVPVYPVNFIRVPSLDDTERGEGGLGSTGTD